MSKKRLDTIVALLFLCSAVFVFVGTRDLPMWGSYAPGPRLFPLMIAVACGLLGSIFLSQALRRSRDDAVDLPDKTGMVRVVSTAVLLFLVPISAPWLGFITASVLFTLLMLLFVLRMKAVPSLVTTALMAGAIYVIFVVWLDIRLPTGLLGI